MKFRSHPLDAVLTVMFLLVGTRTYAAAPVEVGVIVDYSPPGGSLYIERAAQTKPDLVEIGMIVYAGDSVRLPSNSSATIELADNRRVTSTGPGIWKVPPSPALGAIAEIFHRFEFIIDPNYTKTATAITRGMGPCQADDKTPIVVPDVPPGAKLKAGRRGLSLAWTGGCPPYRVSLQSEHASIQTRSHVNGQQLRLGAVTLSPGRYTLTITDVMGSRRVFPLQALSQSPEVPSALANGTSHLGTVARALWLADIDGGAWRLDSVEALLPLSRTHDVLAASVVQMLLSQPVGAAAPTP